MLFSFPPLVDPRLSLDPGFVECVISPSSLEGGNWAVANIMGLLAGSGDLFLLNDRGLASLLKGLPWSVQSALLGAAFYYLTDATQSGGSNRNESVAVLAVFLSNIGVMPTHVEVGYA